jgi:hypothetical protein
MYNHYIFSLLTDGGARVVSFAHNTRIYAYELPTASECIPPAVLPPKPAPAPATSASSSTSSSASLDSKDSKEPVPTASSAAPALVSIPIYVKFIHRTLIRSGFGADADPFFTINNQSVKLFAVPFVLLLPSLVGWEQLYAAVWSRVAHFVSPAYTYEPGVTRPFMSLPSAFPSVNTPSALVVGSLFSM